MQKQLAHFYLSLKRLQLAKMPPKTSLPAPLRQNNYRKAVIVPSRVLSIRESGLESIPMPQGLYLSQKMALAQVLAPQLQQSLALLQAPTLELQALVQQEMEQNPVLEEVPDADLQLEKADSNSDGDDAPVPSAEADPAEPPADTQYDPATEKDTKDPVDEFQVQFDQLQQLDQDWRDHFAATNVP